MLLLLLLLLCERVFFHYSIPPPVPFNGQYSCEIECWPKWNHTIDYFGVVQKPATLKTISQSKYDQANTAVCTLCTVYISLHSSLSIYTHIYIYIYTDHGWNYYTKLCGWHISFEFDFWLLKCCATDYKQLIANHCCFQSKRWWLCFCLCYFTFRCGIVAMAQQ